MIDIAAIRAANDAALKALDDRQAARIHGPHKPTGSPVQPHHDDQAKRIPKTPGVRLTGA